MLVEHMFLLFLRSSTLPVHVVWFQNCGRISELTYTSGLIFFLPWRDEDTNLSICWHAARLALSKQASSFISVTVQVSTGLGGKLE